MKAKGHVSFVSGKDFGQKTLYSFRLSTEEKWFRSGEVKPNISKGDLIEFEYSTKNGNHNVDLTSINVLVDSESSEDSSPRQAADAVRQAPSQGDYWARRELRDREKDTEYKANSRAIQYQSARNAAISVVDILVRDKILKLSDAAKADNVAVVLGKIDDLTNEFFEKCSSIPGSGDDVGGSGSSAGARSTGDSEGVSSDSVWK